MNITMMIINICDILTLLFAHCVYSCIQIGNKYKL